MKNRDLYTSALCLLAESLEDGENEDYEERAPYLLAAFCTEIAEVDKKLRLSQGTQAKAHDPVYLDLDTDFPLSDRFSNAASLYLAAMLILDSDEERSDSLYEKYCDSISSIADSIPASTESIVNRYF